jgi:hypothetical protein
MYPFALSELDEADVEVGFTASAVIRPEAEVNRR